MDASTNVRDIPSHYRETPNCYSGVCVNISDPDLKFEVGDRVKFVPRLGHVEEGVILAVFETTAGTELNLAFGKGLSACVNARQVVEKLYPLN
jgi:hypothetical protein